MKAYEDRYIKRAEIAQLILLHHIYSQSKSENIIFQGGTAIRWCYGGNRFSEDLDFVTTFSMDTVNSILKKALIAVEREMIPHFGLGQFSIISRPSRKSSLKLFVIYNPERKRERISVKLEFEGLSKGKQPEKTNIVLSSLTPIQYLVSSGAFKIPRPNSVLVVETLEEILSDKVRALLERRYIKGRDIYDIWFLKSILNIQAKHEVIKRKFIIYKEPFVPSRKSSFFITPTTKEKEELTIAIENDLKRFLPPDVMSVYKKDGYKVFVDAIQQLFQELQEKEVLLP